MTTNRIKELRLKNGLTLKQLENELLKKGVKVTDGQLSKWENGASTRRADVWAGLALVFNTSIPYLMGVIREKKEHSGPNNDKKQTKISFTPEQKNKKTLSILGIPVLTDTPELVTENSEYIKEQLINNIETVEKNTYSELQKMKPEERSDDKDISIILSHPYQPFNELPLEKQKELAKELIEKIIVEEDSINIYWTF